MARADTRNIRLFILSDYIQWKQFEITEPIGPQSNYIIKDTFVINFTVVNDPRPLVFASRVLMMASTGTDPAFTGFGNIMAGYSNTDPRENLQVELYNLSKSRTFTYITLNIVAIGF